MSETKAARKRINPELVPNIVIRFLTKKKNVKFTTFYCNLAKFHGERDAIDIVSVIHLNMRFDMNQWGTSDEFQIRVN